jgi:hypothetical protein
MLKTLDVGAGTVVTAALALAWWGDEDRVVRRRLGHVAGGARLGGEQANMVARWVAVEQ